MSITIEKSLIESPSWGDLRQQEAAKVLAIAVEKANKEACETLGDVVRSAMAWMEVHNRAAHDTIMAVVYSRMNQTIISLAITHRSVEDAIKISVQNSISFLRDFADRGVTEPVEYIEVVYFLVEYHTIQLVLRIRDIDNETKK